MYIVLHLKMYNSFLRFIILQLLWLGILAGCESYNTNTNIETAYYPEIGQSPEDPEEYIDGVLKKMYPKIGKYNLKIKSKSFDVKFYMGGNHFNVKFDRQGNWKKSVVEVRYQLTLPPPVKESITNLGFDNWYLATKALTQTSDSIVYKMSFRKKEEEWDVWLDRQGKVVKKRKQIKKVKNKSL